MLLRLFSSGGEWGLLWLWRVGFSLWWLVSEHRLHGMLASVVAALGFSSCGSRALEHRLNSVALGLRCSKACGIISDQGSHP